MSPKSQAAEHELARAERPFGIHRKWCPLSLVRCNEECALMTESGECGLTLLVKKVEQELMTPELVENDTWQSTDQ